MEEEKTKVGLMDKIKIRRMLKKLKEKKEIAKKITDEKEREYEKIRMQELIRQSAEIFTIETEEGNEITEADISTMEYEKLEEMENDIIKALEGMVE